MEPVAVHSYAAPFVTAVALHEALWESMASTGVRGELAKRCHTTHAILRQSRGYPLYMKVGFSAKKVTLPCSLA